MSASSILVLAIGLIGYALISRPLSRRSITAPMFFVAIGWVLGSSGLGMIEGVVDESGVEVLAEATLVVVLFTDATRIDLRVLRRQIQLPARLLGIGLPLTVLAGAGAAVLLLDELRWIDALLLAAILAPTDAALGQAVVSAREVPVKIRQALNVESGLNDGIALPLVAALAVVATLETNGATDVVGTIGDAGGEILFGVAAGAVVGGVFGWALRLASARELVDGIARQVATLAVPGLAFAVTQATIGNGFIAAFVAGLAFGHAGREICEASGEFAEDAGQLLTWVTFTLFGAWLVGPALRDLSWQIGVYAIASLTLVRIVPVVLSLIGARLRPVTGLFLGWFGPRGLASILFMLLILDSHVAASETIEQVVVVTVLASVVLHGVTSRPLASRYAELAMDEEMGEVEEMPSARRGGLNQM